MNGGLLDLVLVVATVLFAYSGWRQGFVVGALSFIGFLGGGLLGAQSAPAIADLVEGLPTALVAIVVVFAFATLGQLLLSRVGIHLRHRVTNKSARIADSAAGAGVSAVSLLLVAWLVGTAVASSPFTGLAAAVRHSEVLQQVDHAVPDSARRWFTDFRQLVSDQGFPEVFDDLAPTKVRPVDPPDPRVLQSQAVAVSRRATLKVTGVAESCSRRVEGTGFVYAPERVMTNAHVVAGVRRPRVHVGDRRLEGRVVVFDSGRDLAVIYVPGLDIEPLAFAGRASSGDQAIVAGYPEDGPYDPQPARVRGTQVARGPDIYHERTVNREVYVLRALVRPGNSGGPLLAPDGRVYGVVFAAAADRNDTGYALTAKEAAGDARAGATATRRVSTRHCD